MSLRKYPNEGQYSPISVQQPFYCITINIILLFYLRNNFFSTVNFRQITHYVGGQIAEY